MVSKLLGKEEKGERAYGNFEINEFLGESAHLIVEAEAVFAWLGGCEYEIPLTLLGSVHYYSVIGPSNFVVDVEGSSCLDLYAQMISVGFREDTTPHEEGGSVD